MRFAPSLAAAPNCCNPGRTSRLLNAAQRFAAPRDVNHSGTKHRPFGFPEGAGQGAELFQTWAGLRSTTIPVSDTHVRSRCAATRVLYEARHDSREGDERLSARKRSEPDEAAHEMRSKKPHTTDKNGRKQRSADLGRALRTIYDDTLRESVPDDFRDLIGKLS
jgi:hypothetical protein